MTWNLTVPPPRCNYKYIQEELSLPLEKSRSLTIKEGFIQQRKQHLLSSPLLLNIGPDLVGWEHKSCLASIPQLNGVRELGLSHAVHVVGRRTGSNVQHSATGSEGVCCLIVGAVPDSGADEGSSLCPFTKLGRVEIFLVAEGREDVLAVLNLLA